MNFKLALVSALAAGMVPLAGLAQAAASPVAKPAAPPMPQAVAARIAIIEFEQVAAATNEGQKAIADIEKNYEPQKASLQKLTDDIASLTKQLQNAPATMTEDEKASRARDIDTKQKQLQRDGQDAQTAYDADVQDAIGKIGQKLEPVVMKYVQDNGYTMLLDNTGQQGGLNVLWAPGTDISQAVVDAYNAASGVAAPVPSAPTSAAPAHPRPSAPKPAAATPAK